MASNQSYWLWATSVYVGSTAHSLREKSRSHNQASNGILECPLSHALVWEKEKKREPEVQKDTTIHYMMSTRSCETPTKLHTITDTKLHNTSTTYPAPRLRGGYNPSRINFKKIKFYSNLHFNINRIINKMER